MTQLKETDKRFRERPSEPDYDAEMKLSDGKTCDDCFHARRCFGMGFSSTGRKSCDFYPSRYRPA